MNETDHRAHREMRLFERLRFAMKDLWKRRVMTAFNGAGVLIAVVYVLWPSFYGLSIYRYQRSVLDESLPTLVVASCPNVADEKLRFTNERIAELASMPEAKLAFPKVELGVKLSLDSRSSINLPIEGTVPNDPALSTSRLIWGRPAQGSELRQAVIPKALFEKMGGILSDDGPTPSNLSVQVSRTVAGEVQNQMIPLEIVGIVRHQSFDKVYTTLEFVQQLDQWCSNKINAVGGEPERPRVDYPFCFAYVPQAERHRVEAEAEQLKVHLQLEGEFTAYDAPRDVWLAVDGDRTGVLSPDILKSVEALGGEVHPVRTLEWQSSSQAYTVTAFSSADPRWRDTAAGQSPGFGEVYMRSLPSAPDPRSFEAMRVIGDFSPQCTGDIFCTPATLQFLAFDYATSPSVGRMTLVETRRFDLASRWEQINPGCVTPDQTTSWGIYELHRGDDESGADGIHTEPKVNSPNAPAAMQGDMQINSPQPVSRAHPADELRSQFLTAVPDVECEITYEGSVRLTESSAVTSIVRCCFVPDPLFNRLTANQPDDRTHDERTVPCIQVGIDRNISIENSPRIGGRRLKISATLPGATLTLLFPASARRQLCPTAGKSGVACWADWRRASEIDDFFAQRRDSVSPLRSSGPRIFSRAFEGDLQSARRWLGEDSRHCALVEMISLAADVTCEGQTVASVCATPIRSGSFDGNLCVLPSASQGPQEASIEAGSYQHRTRLEHFNRLPRGIAVLDRAAFRRLVFETSSADGSLPEFGTGITNIRVGSVYYSRVRKVLEEAGLRAAPLVPVREQVLLKYKVGDAEQRDGRVGQELVRVLSMTRPTFVAAVPAMPTQAVLNGEIVLDASTPTDPRRFDAKLSCGDWLTGDSRNEIILPASKVEQLLQGKPLRDGVGTVVEVEFQRPNRVAASEPALRMPLKVVGVVQNDTAVVPLELLQQISLWKDGKVVFNDSRMTFETPSAIYTRRGHVRCNIHASDLTSVEPLVKKLQQLGYQTEDSLADQQGLRRLGRALTFVVATFALGCLLIAGKMIVVTAMMNVHTKRWEIGLLKAHGMSTRSILSIFAMQGALIGTGAFLIGSGFVAALEPALRSWIGVSFKIPMETVVTGSVLSAESVWLLFVALAAALVLSTFGIMLPAAGAAAQLPVETLQRRE